MVSVSSSAGQDLIQPLSEYTAEADSNTQAASDWTREHSLVTWHADRLLHDSRGALSLFLAFAAPRSSAVAGNAAFLSLARSQRQVSR
jgi:hypothetical protein